jgi:putative peptidoglycan lipid II flippase
MLPRLSKLVAAGDQAGARGALDEAVNLSMAFTLPAAAAMMAAPAFMLEGLFTRGAFTAEDARNCAMALFHYGWGVPAFVLAKIYAPGFFAREDTQAPMRFALISMGLNIVLGAAFFFALRAAGHAGFPGLAIATSVAAWANVILMIGTLSRRGDYAPGKQATSRLVRIALVSLALGVALYVCQVNREALIAALGSKEAAVAVMILGGGTAYFIVLFIVGAVTFSEVRAAFQREKGAPAGSAGLPPGLDA